MSGYIFSAAGHGQYDPNGQVDPPVADVGAHNREVEQIELAIWETQPDRAIAYISDQPIDRRGSRTSTHEFSTWLGTRIGYGEITGQYRGFWSSTILCVRCRGTNGAVYIGRFGKDGGTAVRLRKITSRS